MAWPSKISLYLSFHSIIVLSVSCPFFKLFSNFCAAAQGAAGGTQSVGLHSVCQLPPLRCCTLQTYPIARQQSKKDVKQQAATHLKAQHLQHVLALSVLNVLMFWLERITDLQSHRWVGGQAECHHLQPG